MLPTFARMIAEMAAMNVQLPKFEYYGDGVPEDVFSERAWLVSKVKLVLFVGDQAGYTR